MPRPKAADREAQHKDTRQKLLDAAVAEFAEFGFESANIDRISRAAGFAKGTIYNYFPTKRDLMLALISQTAELHLGFMSRSILAAESPTERLERFVRSGFAFVTAHTAQAMVMVNTLYGPDQEFKTQMYLAYLPMFELVEHEIITPGVAAGAFRTVDARATAGLLMNIYLGTASQLDEHGRTWIQPELVADFVQHALALVEMEDR
ncbi:MAG: TetR/AcrR family transcriptional regulator [Anaerolineales bacterium]